MKTMTPAELGTEHVRFDLSHSIADVHDPKIQAAIDAYRNGAVAIHTLYKGNLATLLGDALDAFIELARVIEPVSDALMLIGQVEAVNNLVQEKVLAFKETCAAITAEYLVFFDLELAQLPEEVLVAQMKHETVRKHIPHIRQIRAQAPYMLAEVVEAALSRRNAIITSATEDIVEQWLADVRISFPGVTKSFSEAIEIASNAPSSLVRAGALRRIHEALEPLLPFAARALSTSVALKRISDTERTYPHSMASRNLNNMLPDDVVEALHVAVQTAAPALTRRYYGLKARILKTPTGLLNWSDRNAPLPFADNRIIPFDRARDIVLGVFGSFSPELHAIVVDMFNRNLIDAPTLRGKAGGAFCLGGVTQDGRIESYVFMNYLGSTRCILTLAHELGHGVHNRIAGVVQGPLMYHPPLAYAETASVFAEALTFDYLIQDIQTTGDAKAELSLLMRSIDDTMDTVVRQIGFSLFEQKIHGARKQLSPAELSTMWTLSTHELYGPPGETFIYNHIEHLWAYISHFYRPFYVYAYACGQLFTNSLMCQREVFGADFKDMYLDLLRAGGTKNAFELLKPFGLNPADPDFWADGLIYALEQPIARAEVLAKELEY